MTDQTEIQATMIEAKKLAQAIDAANKDSERTIAMILEIEAKLAKLDISTFPKESLAKLEETLRCLVEENSRTLARLGHLTTSLDRVNMTLEEIGGPFRTEPEEQLEMALAMQ